MESATNYQNDLWPDNCVISPPMMGGRRPPLLQPLHAGKPDLSVVGPASIRQRTPTGTVAGVSVSGDRLRQDYMTRNGEDSGILHMDSTMVINGDMKQSHVRVLRPHSTPATLMWLEENYEVAEGVCIPRSTLYMHYVDFCAKNYMQPVNAASFGKIIRQQFPQLTTRRLGTRGQSRYHYYGIAVRETSPYFQLSFSKKGASGCESRREIVKQVPLYSPRTRAGTVLPEFPSVKDLNLPPSVDVEKITTFLMMYRTHCQRVLDTVIRASFDEVQNFLLHFWQGMPPHLASILETNVLVNLVGVCDSILYRTISNVLLPSMLQTLPDSLTKVVRRFIQELDCWLKMAMCNLPENLKLVKLEMATRFAQMLRRQMSLNHLAQASRMVVHNSDITGQMLHDWRQVDLDAICRETLYSTEHNQNGTTFELILKLSKDFESLLEEEVPIDNYVEWLETLVNKCVVMPTTRRKVSVRRLARQFLLMWSAFGTRIIRDMTLHSAASFGSFHLLRLMFDDYVLFLVETIHTEDQMKDFMRNIVNDSPPQFSDSALGDYSNVSFGLEMEPQAYTGSSLPEQYSCESEPNTTSPPAQEVPASAGAPREFEEVTAAATEEDEQLSTSCTWMPGEYYQSFYQGSNYDSRRSWPTSTVFTRPENKPYNYQQSAQYVIVSQDNAANRPERDSCRSTSTTGYDYGGHYPAGLHQEDSTFVNHEHNSTPSIMYTASGAIYQSYTVVASPYHNSQPERTLDKSRVHHHHVTVRMDGTLYCDS